MPRVPETFLKPRASERGCTCAVGFVKTGFKYQFYAQSIGDRLYLPSHLQAVLL